MNSKIRPTYTVVAPGGAANRVPVLHLRPCCAPASKRTSGPVQSRRTATSEFRKHTESCRRSFQCQAGSCSATIGFGCAVACGCLMLLMLSCSFKQELSMTRSAVEGFHNRLEAQEDKQILTDATPEFRKSMNAETGGTLFARIRRKLGSPRVSKPISIRVNRMLTGTFIVAQFETSFDKGDAQENFTWRLQDGKPRLDAYSVNSPLLATD